MKGKHILFLFIFSIALILTGAFFKLNHVEGANLSLSVGLILEALTILLVIIKYWKSLWKFLQK